MNMATTDGFFRIGTPKKVKNEITSISSEISGSQKNYSFDFFVKHKHILNK